MWNARAPGTPPSGKVEALKPTDVRALLRVRAGGPAVEELDLDVQGLARAVVSVDEGLLYLVVVVARGATSPECR